MKIFIFVAKCQLETRNFNFILPVAKRLASSVISCAGCWFDPINIKLNMTIALNKISFFSNFHKQSNNTEWIENEFCEKPMNVFLSVEIWESYAYTIPIYTNWIEISMSSKMSHKIKFNRLSIKTWVSAPIGTIHFVYCLDYWYIH